MDTEANERCRTAVRRRRAGSALVCTEVLMAIASTGIGSVMFVTLSYLTIARKAYARDRAFYLAESGLTAALVRLNAIGDADIPHAASRDCFGSTFRLSAPDWGFQTQLTVATNGEKRVVSVGRFRGEKSTVSATVELLGGQQDIHAMFAHALYAGNSSGDTNYVLQIGGTGAGSDFVAGDTYSGNDLTLSGDARLRHPELLMDIDGDGVCTEGEPWNEALVLRTFAEPLSQGDFDAYVASMQPYMGNAYNNGAYDYGEAYVDTIGNGVYDLGEPFTDTNGNGVRDPEEPFVDQGNGRWDPGEQWIEDTEHSTPAETRPRENNRYDPAGGWWEYHDDEQTWTWQGTDWSADWPAESFEDLANGVYDPTEVFEDGNGVYDPGEQFLDDRNSRYDYGTQATGNIDGMPSPGTGQDFAHGGDAPVDPPNLAHMYYDVPKTNTAPSDALPRWGNDYRIDQSTFNDGMVIAEDTNPAHIFVRNPPTSGSTVENGKQVQGRTYAKVYDQLGQPRDDYFLEDPTDASYNTYISEDAIDGTDFTAPMYVNVREEHNVRLYYIDGNLYIHNPMTYSARFRTPGTRVTFVVRGNVTISDEFFYNADYPAGLQRPDLNSGVAGNPRDALCLIALKDANTEDSGNIYLGDPQFGTGGGVHAMLYAENNFVDMNLNTSDQEFLSVFGSMTAGNHVELNRSGANRTRLDITLDERILGGEAIVPGLPHAAEMQRRIDIDAEWVVVGNSWRGCNCRVCRGFEQ